MAAQPPKAGTVETLPCFGALSARDQDELRRFESYLRRRVEKRDEPAIHSYAESFGEVLYDEENG